MVQEILDQVGLMVEKNLFADIIGIDADKRLLFVEKKGGRWGYKYRDELDEETRAVIELRQTEGWATIAQAEFERHGQLLLLKAIFL